MIRPEYLFPYGAIKMPDPLIGVETEFGWIKQRLSNLTDYYVVTNSQGTDSVIDVTRAKFYITETEMGTLVEYAKEHLREYFEYAGITMHVYEVKK